ncbi:hypothetical protein L798_05940 [Zootermopsis nevadensis]|uniref:Uncharacterized protein n=1 Tax=Zootermopsis nevadensis TaxID=136037 RepID=A0A067RHX4_ZOONE|nr:hypothetical protein L798_05940 [Zootermopsis nevadensis]
MLRTSVVVLFVASAAFFILTEAAGVDAAPGDASSLGIPSAIVEIIRDFIKEIIDKFSDFVSSNLNVSREVVDEVKNLILEELKKIPVIRDFLP